MNKPTKETQTPEGTFLEFDARHSVELTNTVKDGWRVSSVKIYDHDELRANARPRP